MLHLALRSLRDQTEGKTTAGPLEASVYTELVTEQVSADLRPDCGTEKRLRTKAMRSTHFISLRGRGLNL